MRTWSACRSASWSAKSSRADWSKWWSVKRANPRTLRWPMPPLQWLRGSSRRADRGMHKAIIFDLGKVLVHFDFKRGYQALEGLCAYPAAEIPKRIGTTD